MNLLIIGGSIFLGKHLTQQAIARGHSVTLFNRGIHNPDLFPEAAKIKGDRNSDCALLAGGKWDAVIDTCGSFPRQITMVMDALRGNIGHYTFISSISAFSDFSTPGMDESGPVGSLEDETMEEVTFESYGPLKVLCERAVQQAMPGHALNIRPGLIVGRDDWSDRFSYWPRRIARGGQVLLPGKPEAPVQIIDVEDLAAWTLNMTEQGKSGLYSATGPGHQLTMADVADACRSVSGSDATFTWVPDEFLLREGVGQWMELPLWIAEDPAMAGFSQVDCGRAIADGLTFRPLAETVRAVLDWSATLPVDRQPRAGISAEREAELLKKWHAEAVA